MKKKFQNYELSTITSAKKGTVLIRMQDFTNTFYHSNIITNHYNISNHHKMYSYLDRFN